MTERVAILGSQNPLEMRKMAKEIIEEAGFQADILDFDSRDLTDFQQDLAGYSAVITCGEAVPGRAIRYLAARGLRLISRSGVGTDEMDHEAATQCGVAICNAAGALSTTVAECAMALILNVLRDFPNADTDVRRGDWSRFFQSKCSRQLEGKTVGLIGFGDIAKALARMLYGFNCRILAYDIHFDQETAAKYDVEQADIPAIQREADVVSLHVPALPDTIGMVDMDFLKGMKRTAILINTGRGKLVVEEDLIRALQEGIIAGAGLDVFAHEPLSTDSPLIGMKNVMLLPHYASTTLEALTHTNRYSAENVVRFLKGEPVPTILNPTYAKALESRAV